MNRWWLPKSGLAAASVTAGLLFLSVPLQAQVQERPGTVALLQAKLFGYAVPVIVAAPGEEITFTNIDIELHNVVQDVAADGFGSKKPMPWCKKGKKGKKKGHAGHSHGSECPVFWTPLIALGKTTPIFGLENVESGQTYSFFCTLHHGMKGTLVTL